MDRIDVAIADLRARLIARDIPQQPASRELTPEIRVDSIRYVDGVSPALVADVERRTVDALRARADGYHAITCDYNRFGALINADDELPDISVSAHRVMVYR